jgi:hypothetical protein
VEYIRDAWYALIFVCESDGSYRFPCVFLFDGVLSCATVVMRLQSAMGVYILAVCYYELVWLFDACSCVVMASYEL